jgi:hypothetical protein
LHLGDQDNATALNYLRIVTTRMQEAATNEISTKLSFPTR